MFLLNRHQPSKWRWGTHGSAQLSVYRTRILAPDSLFMYIYTPENQLSFSEIVLSSRAVFSISVNCDLNLEHSLLNIDHIRSHKKRKANDSKDIMSVLFSVIPSTWPMKQHFCN